ncbi:hypothetical protein [Isoptericola sp. NPDC057559]|uniref:hypothetical protein n=1 Tax=Isoptericola sp. NPDC057559 TaxID=3346168 RepID=UPI0036B1B074
MNDEARLGEQLDEALATGAAIEHAIREHRGKCAPAWSGLWVPVVDRGAFAILPLAQALAQALARPGDAGEEPLVGSTNRAQSRRRRMLRDRAAADVSWTWPD